MHAGGVLYGWTLPPGTYTISFPPPTLEFMSLPSSPATLVSCHLCSLEALGLVLTFFYNTQPLPKWLCVYLWLRSNVTLSEIPFLDFSPPTYSNMTQFVFPMAFPHVRNLFADLHRYVVHGNRDLI